MPSHAYFYLFKIYFHDMLREYYLFFSDIHISKILISDIDVIYTYYIYTHTHKHNIIYKHYTYVNAIIESIYTNLLNLLVIVHLF